MRPHIADEREDDGAPRRAGRYLLGRVLGAGAMGVVRASYDPALDREIAVKLIGVPDGGPLSDTDDEDATRSQLLQPAGSLRPQTSAAVNDAQLLAEARALARVAHPNIVEVFDVGVCEAGVFIAMEMVDGVSLRAWNDAHSPDWRAAVELYLAAGEALAAAHRVGIVHGDFKPDNVLVSESPSGAGDNRDRVKVVDFGLARAMSWFEPISSDADPERTQPRPSTAFGTPAYLAPECWADAQREHTSDQFAFFVALFEAIAGRRPFRRADSLGGLLLQMSEGVDARELDGFAPKRLVRAIMRGIDPDPARRFAAMSDALVELRAAVADDRRRRSRRRLVAAGLVVAVPILVATGGSRLWSSWRERSAIAACAVQAREIDSEWNEDARGRVHAALVAADPRTGAATLARVVPWLDGYAAAWSELREDTCVRAVTDAVVTSTIDLARERCFGEGRASLAALVEVLVLADDGVVRNAVRSAADLPRVASCDDESWLALQTSLPEDPVVLERVAEVQRSLARADQLAGAGRADDALELADAAVASAADLAWPAVLARARASRGTALRELGRYDEAERELESAYFHADEAADDVTRARVAAELASLVGTRLARFDDGLVWVRHAETALAAIGGPEAETHARLAIATAAIHFRRGAIEEGIAPAERALAIRLRIFGPDHPSVGAANLTLGTTLGRLDRMPEALAHFDRARENFELAFGPDHPDLAVVYHNLGMAYVELEQYDEAKRLNEQGLAIREAVLAPDHPDVATSLVGVAYAELGLHRFEEAKRGFERALVIREARLGPDHPAVAATLADVGQVAALSGNCREAVVAFDRALAIAQKANADDHRSRLSFGLNLGDALLECHESERALVQYEAARTLAAATPDKFGRELARASSGIAKARVTAG